MIKFPLAKLKEKFAKETFSVGLDIGASAVKLVKLRFFKDQVQLSGFELAETQVDLTEILKNISRAQNINKVNISVSGPSTIIRYVSFPRMSEIDLKKSLQFEAQRHIPFPLNELILDAYTLKENFSDNKMFLLLAAVKKEFLGQRLKLVEDAGFKPNSLDIDAIALINAFNFNYPQEVASDNLKSRTVALLNIGASLSNLSVLEGEVPCLSRDIQIAGAKFTQKLIDLFGLDSKSAESLKLKPDQERAEKVKGAIESVLTNLAAEIRVSFDFYESQSSSAVSKIFLTGGGSLFPGLKEMLSNLLGIEVEYWDPFSRISIVGNLDSEKAKAQAAQLAVAIGLALRQ
ncbi:MAG: type IV pilus assembly protein PilM [Candidatus Omnitrophica bacterium]|nr:type IV pilus assembly protein PilM [Candidatus Omnitrophota bacterium]